MGVAYSGGDIMNKRAVAPSHKISMTSAPVVVTKPISATNCPEVTIRTVTWTRESHGLFDFEGSEIERKVFKIKGSHRVFRVESDVRMDASEEGISFEDEEKDLDEKLKDKIVARILHRNGSYWLYHKNFADENIEQILEKKPEEKIWRVVREIRNPELDIPCYRLQKKDLIKVGRVRFKIRDIMSPTYRDIENNNQFANEDFREEFPSQIEDSLLLESSMQMSSSNLNFFPTGAPIANQTNPQVNSNG